MVSFTERSNRSMCQRLYNQYTDGFIAKQSEFQQQFNLWFNNKMFDENTAGSLLNMINQSNRRRVGALSSDISNTHHRRGQSDARQGCKRKGMSTTVSTTLTVKDRRIRPLPSGTGANASNRGSAISPHRAT